MEGPDVLDPNEATIGLIPRIFESLSDAEVSGRGNFEFKIQMSMLEIYNEKVNDLLDPTKVDLKIRGDSKKGFYAEGLTQKIVFNEGDMLSIYQIGCENRTTASTNMNDRSSRSHSLLQLKIEKRDKVDNKVTMSTFNLVDLAGSEKFEAAGNDHELRKEANSINKSLSTLGLVINQLVENVISHKDNYVSFRDSVLTQLLQQSLIGNCITSLILCCSPAKCNQEVFFFIYRKLFQH